jgi:hypothetical protein
MVECKCQEVRLGRAPAGEFGTSLGPVFCNLLLADEINRAPALLAIATGKAGCPLFAPARWTNNTSQQKTQSTAS